MNCAVIDASVVLKWYLVDEEYGAYALSLLEKYLEGALDLLAPSLLEYEVINGLIIAQRKGRIREEKIIEAADGFLSLKIAQKNLSSFFPEAINYSRIYNRSVYDSSYLALASKEGVSLITADKNLLSAVQKDLKWVKWLGDM